MEYHPGTTYYFIPPHFELSPEWERLGLDPADARDAWREQLNRLRLPDSGLWVAQQLEKEYKYDPLYVSGDVEHVPDEPPVIPPGSFWSLLRGPNSIGHSGAYDKPPPVISARDYPLPLDDTDLSPPEDLPPLTPDFSRNPFVTQHHPKQEFDSPVSQIPDDPKTTKPVPNHIPTLNDRDAHSYTTRPSLIPSTGPTFASSLPYVSSHLGRPGSCPAARPSIARSDSLHSYEMLQPQPSQRGESDAYSPVRTAAQVQSPQSASMPVSTPRFRAFVTSPSPPQEEVLNHLEMQTRITNARNGHLSGADGTASPFERLQEILSTPGRRVPPASVVNQKEVQQDPHSTHRNLLDVVQPCLLELDGMKSALIACGVLREPQNIERLCQLISKAIHSSIHAASQACALGPNPTQNGRAEILWRNKQDDLTASFKHNVSKLQRAANTVRLRPPRIDKFGSVLEIFEAYQRKFEELTHKYYSSLDKLKICQMHDQLSEAQQTASHIANNERARRKGFKTAYQIEQAKRQELRDRIRQARRE